MELVGLQRQMRFLADRGVSIHSLITDRHVGINKWMRENWPAVQHKYDLWHVTKSFKKKALKKSAMKENAALIPWLNKMVRHLYSCVKASDSPEQLEARWRSLELHITNTVNIL